jgi:GNAT superfamily N-acetyltransferase
MSDAPADLLVRWATRWDREALTRMVVALAVQHHVQTTPEVVSDAFDYALANPDHVRFCVAERDKTLIGVASIHTAFSTWRSAPFGTVEDVYVEPEARRSGVASALLAFLFEQARRRGFCRLQLDVQGDNTGARAFYESIGMADSGYHVYVAGLLDEPAETP